MTKSHSDPVHRPDHYARWPIEPMQLLLRNICDYWRGNVVKYVMRACHKVQPGKTVPESEIEDLRKAIRYLEMCVNLLKGEREL
jgi:hypothetical protein